MVSVEVQCPSLYGVKIWSKAGKKFVKHDIINFKIYITFECVTG